MLLTLTPPPPLVQKINDLVISDYALQSQGVKQIFNSCSEYEVLMISMNPFEVESHHWTKILDIERYRMCSPFN